MSDPAPPPIGHMFLWDGMTPPLLDGSYRWTARANVRFGADLQPLADTTTFFDVIGPRFSLPPSEVAGVFPPRNGHGPFQESIPHVALGRRTLPWERQLDSQGKIGEPKRAPGDPPKPNELAPGSGQFLPYPWMALLLFEEGEYTIVSNAALEDVVPGDVFQRLGSPQGIVCDAVEARADLVSAILPSVEELALLAHVRQVNVEDRELAAGDSDGWFAVVMGNRLPSPGVKCRACLVSLEERADLVAADPPPVASPIGNIGVGEVFDGGLVFEGGPPAPAGGLGRAAIEREFADFARGGREINPGLAHLLVPQSVRMVLLFSWTFECEGPGTFQDLMQDVDVAMIGTALDPGHPALTDTGHLRIEIGDRAGEREVAWYRGPLVPFPLTRDALGPYHSADQARRATPETGAEDVSYAAAFEVGRLLAAADPRLAQELMRWRREAFRQSARADVLVAVAKILGPSLPLALDVHRPVVPVIAAGAIAALAGGAGPLVDPFGLALVSRAIGFDPGAVQAAWALPTLEAARAVLGGDPGVLGAVPPAVPQTARPATTIDDVARDTAGLAQLQSARRQLLVNAARVVRGENR